MGNASKRGTFEQRKAFAIERDRTAMLEAERQRIDRKRALTPEERERRHKERMSMAYIMGLAATFKRYGRR